MRFAALTFAAAFAAYSATPVFRNTAPQVGFVGSEVCAACHKQTYDKYKQTAMGRSITRARPGMWGEPARVERPALNRELAVFSERGELYQSESETRNGAEVYRTVHKLEYAIGSGQNGVSFVVQRGGYLFQAPLSFYSKAAKWNLSPGFEQADEGFSRPLAEACIACHAGRPRPVAGRDGLYRDPPFAEMAIGCENCHGPGELHVAERRRGRRTLPDTSIVNPARLPARLAEDICMKCHQAGDVRVLLPGKQYGDFRPGLPLVRTVAIFGLHSAAKDADLLEHHASMKMSRCYRATNGKLSCFTCHNPHEQPVAAAAPAYFNAKCLGCHTVQSCGLQPASRKQTSPPDNCIGCHMPRRDVERISHSALTNHRIPARTGMFTARAAVPELELIDTQPGESELPLITRLAVYGEILGQAPELRDKYLALLDEAKRTLPDNGLVLAALGRKALAEENPDAIALLTKAEEQGSASAATYLDLGQALVAAGRLSEAVADLERGQQSFPYSKPVRKYLILSYIRKRSYAQAKSALESYVKDFPEDSFMRGLLAQTGPR